MKTNNLESKTTMNEFFKSLEKNDSADDIRQKFIKHVAQDCNVYIAGATVEIETKIENKFVVLSFLAA